MRQRSRRCDEFKAVALQGQAAEEGRSRGQRVDGGADIVDEPGQGQSGRPGASPEQVFGLQHCDFPAAASELDRGRQAVGSGAHHDRVRSGGLRHMPLK
jgi:hypothetical protein